MNPKTFITNIVILVLLQITKVNSLQAYHKKDYTSEYAVRPDTVVRMVISNELFGLKKGNAGFVCDKNGSKVWKKTKPGDKYVVVQFKYDGKKRHTFTHCHLRSNFGFVNFPVSVHPDTSAHCYPNYVCGYSVRKDGVFYKPENKLYRWKRDTSV